MTGLLFLLLPCMAVTSAHACPEGDDRCSDVSDCQDHIQPSQDQDGYYAALRTLLVDANAETYVIWVPSFWTESAVALQERSGVAGRDGGRHAPASQGGQQGDGEQAGTGVRHDESAEAGTAGQHAGPPGQCGGGGIAPIRAPIQADIPLATLSISSLS